MFLEAPQSNERLLEIGCGNGAMLQKMQTRGWSVAGIEFDPECVAQIRARGLKCYDGDLRELALASKTLSAIYMGHVIEHLHDPRSLLKECLRLLTPGGRLVLVTPNAQGWGHRHYTKDWRGLETPRHLQLFSPQSLRRLTEETGFRECNVRTTNRGAWYSLGMSAAMRSAREKASHDAAVLAMVSGRAFMFQLFGRVFGLVRPNEGEEIILSALKP